MLRNARQAGRAPLRRGGRAGKAIASIAAPFWGCPVMNCKAKPPFQWNDVSMLQLKRKSLQLPDGLLTKVYKDIVNGYHNENCWFICKDVDKKCR